MQRHAAWPALMALGLATTLGAAILPAQATSQDVLLRLLQQRRCSGCRLQDADLVHADLRDADLRRAQLQRANLSQARLDGANLQGADLRFISLQGASLRGANLRGALLDGADLRQADLSGALLDEGALGRTHWDQAIGINLASALSYAELHNAGVSAAKAGRLPEAERLFGDAIRKQPLAAISWLARGLCRADQGKLLPAAADFDYAATLYEQGGELELSADLRRASKAVVESPKTAKGGNGKGMQAVAGAMTAFQFLAPLASKALIPMPF